jgi:hypothetical protein
MKLISLVCGALLAIAFVSPGARAAVWKCTDNGRVAFSDSPCPTSGARIDERRLQGNVVQAEHVYASPRGVPEPDNDRVGGGDDRSDRGSNGSLYSGSARNVCPAENDIRNMQVKANSITLNREQKQFIYDEIRRARQCAMGQGNYSPKDWQVSQEAMDAQNSIGGGRKERINAEGVHSAADPIEGDRIAARRAQEAAVLAYAEAKRRRRAEEQSRVMLNSRISSCYKDGCYATPADR